jgi:threonine/homoserine/homoserine lactone efflux protein
MTIHAADLALYGFGILLLFLTPGPVWVALLARGLSGGFSAAWPLAVGVTLGDLMWPFLAILGMGWVLSVFDGVIVVMRWVACGTFIVMGALILRSADKPPGQDTRLTRPGKWAGFVAGVAVIIGNPKAILFYMGILPGYFDLPRLTWPDVALICAVSMVIPLAGNLAIALSVDRLRRLMTAPRALRRMNMTAGSLLILVGLAIPLL